MVSTTSGAARLSYNAASELLELLFQRREVLDGVCAAVADHHRRLALKQCGPTSFSMSAPAYWLSASVLTMMSGAQAQACVDSRHEALCKSAVVHEAYYVVYAQLLCTLHGAVGAAVVDDEVFDLVDTVDVPLGEVVYGHVEGLGLRYSRVSASSASCYCSSF